MKLRIAFANTTRRLVGGAEAFIGGAARQLTARGHSVMLFSEFEGPRQRAPIPGFEKVSSCAEARGRSEALAALQRWRPDVIYVHSVTDGALESAFFELAPTVLSLHDFTASCVSGTKSFQWPEARPCARTLGPGCLLSYFPRRCGGLNPVTLFTLYGQKRSRLPVLKKYRQVITHSKYMRGEYARLGLPTEVVGYAPFVDQTALSAPRGRTDSPSRLLYVGRLEQTKGVQLLLRALPEVFKNLSRPLSLMLVGEGASRQACEKEARWLTAVVPGIQVQFPGWLAGEALREAFDGADLLVVPSVWPEPFGLVGVEAGLRGVPATAFAVGGIPEWLVDGENGTLASGRMPSASELAQAIVRALKIPSEHARLAEGAWRLAKGLVARNEVDVLERLLG